MANRNIFGFILSSIVGLCCIPGLAWGAAGKFVPPQGKILFFAGQNLDSVDDYLKTVGIIPAGFMTYTSVQGVDALTESADMGAGAQFAQYYVNKYPNTALQIGLYMVDVLEETAEGKFDENIDKLAAFIKNSQRPVFLRIGYEFDGPHNHYEPQAYLKAYRYIVDRLRNDNVTNVAYVWHSFAVRTSKPLMAWYPGDDYVDWFGISFFAQGEDNMKPMLALAKEHNKPFMICEASPAGLGTERGIFTWNNWFKRYFAFIEKNDVKCFCYINIDWDAYPLSADLNWKDCRLGSSDVIKSNWIEEIKKDKYLMSSMDLFDQLGFN